MEQEEEEERGRNKHKEAQVPSLGPFKPTRPVFLSFDFKNILCFVEKKIFFYLPVWYVLYIMFSPSLTYLLFLLFWDLLKLLSRVFFFILSFPAAN